MIEEIYRLFLQCPLTSGALVFQDNNYQGLLLKKDLEVSIKEGDENIFEKIFFAPPDQLESLLFTASAPRNKSLIPCISSEGLPLKPLSYEEFISEFFPEDYRQRFSLIEVFRCYEHPMLILNRFKTVLYANEAAGGFFDELPLGKRVGQLLEGFSVTARADRLLVSREGLVWIMFVSQSYTANTVFYVYQFVRSDEYGIL